jgi:hypothetical protein
MAGGYQLILDRQLGDYVLPDGWVCFAAGNRAEDRAIAIRMPTALGTRFGHIDFEVDRDEWKTWAYDHEIHHDIISFMNFRPKLLHDMDVNARTFPTPRTWEMLNKHIPLVNPANEFDTYKAFVGEGAAGEFSAYRKMSRELPTFEEIMAEPSNLKIPENPGVLYAVAGLLSAHGDLENLDTIIKYANRMPVEYQTVFMTDLANRFDDIEDHPTFVNWAVENQYVLI